MSNIVLNEELFYSVEETAKLLQLETLQVLQLGNAQIIKRECKNSKIYLYKESVENYALAINVDTKRDKRNNFTKLFTLEETMSFLKLYKVEDIHKLIQDNKLSQKIKCGEILITGQSLSKYMNDIEFKKERIAEGYL